MCSPHHVSALPVVRYHRHRCGGEPFPSDSSCHVISLALPQPVTHGAGHRWPARSDGCGAPIQTYRISKQAMRRMYCCCSLGDFLCRFHPPCRRPIIGGFHYPPFTCSTLQRNDSDNGDGHLQQQHHQPCCQCFGSSSL